MFSASIYTAFQLFKFPHYILLNIQKKNLLEMCIKLITTMACGHNFTKHSNPCSLSDSPRHIPDVQFRFFNDTCAKCDPEVQRRRVKIKYEYRHQELLQQYMAAKKSGDKKIMEQVEEMMLENTQLTRQKNFEVGLVRRDPDVMWREESEYQ